MKNQKIFTIFTVLMLIILSISVVNFKLRDRNSKKDNIPQKKYQYTIIFKNGGKANGEILTDTDNVEKVREILFNSKGSIVNDGKKFLYHNSKEIQILDIEEMND